MGNITNSFSYSDFRPSEESVLWMPRNDYQTLLIRTLADNLEGTISRLPSGSRFKIIKAKEVSDGSKVSDISECDHLFGDPAESSEELRKKVGDIYYFSVGAVDIVPVNIDILNLYKFMVDLTIRCRVKFGKIILEYGGNNPHIHVSNDMYEIYGPFISTFMYSKKFIYTTDNGVSYQEYQTDNRKCKGIIKIGDIDA